MFFCYKSRLCVTVVNVVCVFLSQRSVVGYCYKGRLCATVTKVGCVLLLQK